MAGKKAAAVEGGNSKKAQGQARKADSARQKAQAEQDKKDAAESQEWNKGAKSNAKKEAEEAKKLEAARKKAEKEALLKEEEASLPARAGPKNAKTAVKKTRGLDLSQLDDDAPSGPLKTLNATGIDNALDALSLATTSDAAAKIDRHPERRVKAAYTAYEERRLAEMKTDPQDKYLNRSQKLKKIHDEFDKSPDNPKNQAYARYDATKEELAEIKAAEKAKIESRLGSK